MGEPIYTDELYRLCGAPYASTTDIEAWGKLEVGASTEATVKLGLFSYDLSCIAINCAAGAGDYYPYCDMIEARGLDGLAFGIHWQLGLTASTNYCAGFHSEEGRDTMTCT